MFYCIQLLEKCENEPDKLSPLERARFELVKERFSESLFVQSQYRVQYTFDGAVIPQFMHEHFATIVREKITAALRNDPNIDLRPFEKELQITITDVECPGRTVDHHSDSQPDANSQEVKTRAVARPFQPHDLNVGDDLE